MFGIGQELLQKLYESQEKALTEFVKQIADENNVSEEVALYLISKQYNLSYDVDIKNEDGKAQIVLAFKPKSVSEMLATIEDKTEWEKRMHKQLLEETM